MSEEVDSSAPSKPMTMEDSYGTSSPNQTKNTAEEVHERNKKRKDMAPRSKAWSHFRRFKVNDRWRAECKYCHRNYAADTGRNGTSGLNTHLKSCKMNPENKETQQTILSCHSSVKGGKGGSLGAWTFNQMDTRKAVAHMIIVDEHPFSIVERDGFKHLMKVACPQFDIPSRSTVTRDCYGLYLEEKRKLKEFLKNSTQRVSLTTDTWTSEQNINYMCLTIHFVDNDWNLQKRVLNFCPISSHRGEDIGKGVEKCLLDWGIDKVFSITVDNASSNDGAISYLKKRLLSWGTSLLGGKYLHMRCIAHIVNLVVVEGLKEISLSISRVRSAVRYVRQSPNRLKKFKECVEMEKIVSKKLLCLDVPTRWNSTYLMLDTAQRLARAFDRFDDLDPHYRRDLEDEDKVGVPTDEDWENVGHYVKFLEHFYDLTLQISGSLYVTSNVVIHELSDVLTLLKEWELGYDMSLSLMATRMRTKYDKYWGNVEKMNLIIFFAVVLDPRYKFHFVDWLIKKIFSAIDIVTLVKNELVKLFEEYQKLYISQSSSSHISSSERSSCTSEEIAGKKKKGRNRMEYKKLFDESGGCEEKSELERYLDDKLISDDEYEFEILAWWKINGHRYPVLAHMARDILAVPVSTVASESAFSTGGRILDTFRTSLTPKIVQALMCARDWLRTADYPISVEEDLHSLEKIENDFVSTTLDSTIIDI